MATASKIYLIISSGFLLAFISTISLLSKESTAFCALAKAGKAPYNAILASSFSMVIYAA
jgi:hypothetical protein